MAGGCVIGATAGIQAAVAQLAEAALRGGIAASGDKVQLFGPVNATMHIAEGDLRGIAHPHHARAGEEIPIHRYGNLLLTDKAMLAG